MNKRLQWSCWAEGSWYINYFYLHLITYFSYRITYHVRSWSFIILTWLLLIALIGSHVQLSNKKYNYHAAWKKTACTLPEVGLFNAVSRGSHRANRKHFQSTNLARKEVTILHFRWTNDLANYVYNNNKILSNGNCITKRNHCSFIVLLCDP